MLRQILHLFSKKIRISRHSLVQISAEKRVIEWLKKCANAPRGACPTCPLATPLFFKNSFQINIIKLKRFLDNHDQLAKIKLKADQGGIPILLYQQNFDENFCWFRFLLLETAVKAKMLTYVLPTEELLVISFWIFFKYFGNHNESEKTKTIYKFFVDAGVSF